MTGGRVADLRSELLVQVAPLAAGQVLPEVVRADMSRNESVLLCTL